MSGRTFWTFFRPDLVNDLLEHRGGGLRWYTRDTGAVGAAATRLDFGVNALGLLAVLGEDLRLLSDWESPIWARYSTTPDGGVSSELLAAQMTVQPATTVAPESRLAAAIERVDAAFSAKAGEPLFREHAAAEGLIEKAHRFRAARPDGLDALARDINSLIVERIKTEPLRRYAAPKREKWRGMKWLQKALASAIGEDDARTLMSPFFGAYDLRTSASHLGGPDRDDALAKVGIDPSASAVEQGRQLLEAIISTLDGIVEAIGKLP